MFQATAFLTRGGAAGFRRPPSQDWRSCAGTQIFVDIISPGGGKDQGMDAILDFFGISFEDTISFGDGENDIPMLRHAHVE